MVSKAVEFGSAAWMAVRVAYPFSGRCLYKMFLALVLHPTATRYTVLPTVDLPLLFLWGF